MKERFSIVAAVYLIIKNPEGEILFGRRKNSGFYDGWFGLPSGHVDGGESLKQAMIREAKEEIGIDILSQDLHLVHTLHRANTSERERLDFFFTVDAFQGLPAICEPDKCTELAYLDIHIDTQIVSYVQETLQLIEQGHNYSEREFV